MTSFQDIVYSSRKNHENIHEIIIDHHQKIESWFRNQWLKYPAPFILQLILEILVLKYHL